MSVLLLLGLAVVATAVVWFGSGVLEKSSGRLARYYRLPPIVRGAVIAAVGSSFPELSTTVISTLLHGAFELGVAAIVGSAIFNILVIPGISVLVAGKLRMHVELVYKDAQFYIISVAALLIAFSLAVIYNPGEGDGLVGVMTRPVALAPVLLYGLYLFLQYQDTREQRGQNEEASENEISAAREWAMLGLGLVVIVVGVEGLVRAALGLGDLLGTPGFLWGLTVVAAGTSLPDAFVSVRTAQAGEGTVSLANVLGSNIFDLLVAIPVGVLIAGATPVDYSIAAPMMAFLVAATIVLFTFLRTGLILSRWEATVLLALYGVFVAWMILETFGVVSIVF